MDVAIVSNPIAGGWHPLDLPKFLGGNEESIVLLSQAMAEAGFHVEVYTTLRGRTWVSNEGVIYRSREEFDPREAVDVLIGWKARDIWLHPLSAKLKIHASQDVEQAFVIGADRQVDWYATLCTYHTERLAWLPVQKRVMIPLGVDPAEYAPAGEKENLAIYATSPDRGLEQLLTDWPRIRDAHPGMRLLVTYDWSRLERMCGPSGAAYAKRLEALCLDDDIERATYDAAGIKAAFQRAKFYVHPINNPDADLFGFGAMKAQASGCSLVLNTLESGFRDMAREWIPYFDWTRGRIDAQVNPGFYQPAISWKDVVETHWAPLLRGEVAHAA